MKRKLKVCLAMGGGVSLGSFSGAALTESLKLLMLYGKDREGHPYDEIVVDGASGASAGAMALSIMIKTLMDYELMIDKLNGIGGREPISKASLLQDLKDKYGNIPSSKEDSLIALEVAERVQEQIWVKELSIERLFGDTINKNYKYNVDGSFGLLDRNSLLDIAKTYIVGKQDVSRDKIRVLDKNRVVFACSITNASPMPLNRIAQSDNDIENNAINSTSSFNHSELRIIDFVFKEGGKKSLENWLVFKPTSASSNPMEMSLSDTKSWSVLTSTVMACGAFPIAFDPVILERYKKEYVRGWPEAFPKDKTKHNFAYVDGGTFNNEPIREAFKIGAFHDFESNEENTDRIVLFVDPIVRKETDKPLTIDSLSAQKAELDKLTSSISSLVSILRNQGNIKEQVKISAILENFKLKDDLVSFYAQTEKLHKVFTTSFIEIVLAKIEQKVAKDSISLSSDSIIKYFNKKLNEINVKVQVLEAVELDPNYDIATFKDKSVEEVLSPKDLTTVNSKVEFTQLDETRIDSEVLQKMRAIFKKDLPEETKLAEIFELLRLTTDVHKNRFLQAVLLILTELTLKTLGKYPEAKRIPILPINAKNQLIDLPGSEIEAFAGFSSQKSREYAFEYGKYSALKTLSYDQIRQEDDPYFEMSDVKVVLDKIEQKLRQTNFFQYNNYSKDLQGLTKNGVKRIMTIFSPSYLKTLKATLIGAIGGALSLALGVVNVIPRLVKWWANRKLNKGIASVENHSLSPIQISIENIKKKSTTLLIRTADNNKVKVSLKDLGSGRRVGHLFFSKAHKELGIIGEAHVKRPNNIDPNLEIERYNSELEQRIVNKKIVSLELRRRIFRNIRLRNPNEDFNENDTKVASYYLNPTLRLRNDAEAKWEFIDNTRPLYMSLEE